MCVVHDCQSDAHLQIEQAATHIMWFLPTTGNCQHVGCRLQMQTFGRERLHMHTHESNQVISRSYSPGTKYSLRGESGYMYMYTPLPARPAARACEAGILALQSIPSSSVGRGARGMLMVERGITQGCCRPVGRICGWRPSCPQSLRSQVGGLEQRRAIRDQHSFRAGQIKTRFSE